MEGSWNENSVIRYILFYIMSKVRMRTYESFLKNEMFLEIIFNLFLWLHFQFVNFTFPISNTWLPFLHIFSQFLTNICNLFFIKFLHTYTLFFLVKFKWSVIYSYFPSFMVFFFYFFNYNAVKIFNFFWIFFFCSFLYLYDSVYQKFFFIFFIHVLLNPELNSVYIFTTP